MPEVPDIVRDSQLETRFIGESATEVVHTFQDSDPASGRRLVTRTEHCKREIKIGRGAFGSVWLERCIKGSRTGVAPQIHAVQAVKQIELNTQLGSIDYYRELEAIAKFSHTRVSLQTRSLHLQLY